jgi:hypothetical protein
MSTYQDGQHRDNGTSVNDSGQRHPHGVARPRNSTKVGQTAGGAQTSPATGLNARKMPSNVTTQGQHNQPFEKATEQRHPVGGYRSLDSGQRKIRGRD